MNLVLQRMFSSARTYLQHLKLPGAAKQEIKQDRKGLPEYDPGIDAVLRESVAWLCRAQDQSPDQDGGVARHYSLLNGWGRSYPETTGYIIPTLLDWAHRTGSEDARQRAKRMLDWFLRIQLPDGGFQGGMMGAEPVQSVTFNTGQILLGLAAGVAKFGDDYRPALRKAADWLRDTQDPDGCWRRHPTPFAKPGEKAYETHVAWGLLEAARVEPGQDYDTAALKNLGWALSKQQPNGWIADCCLTYPARPLTHTLGYALRGIVEGYRYFQTENLLAAARKTADALVSVTDSQGRLPGRLDRDWRTVTDSVCLTGSVQIAHSLLLLYGLTGEARYRETGMALNQFVRRTIKVQGPDEIRGAVKGSFPIDGYYGRFEYLNWACKFMIDSNLAERDLQQGQIR